MILQKKVSALNFSPRGFVILASILQEAPNTETRYSKQFQNNLFWSPIYPKLTVQAILFLFSPLRDLTEARMLALIEALDPMVLGAALTNS